MDLTESWRKPSIFTSLVHSPDKGVLARVAEKLGLRCYLSNYYSIDAIFYEKRDLVQDRPSGSTWVTGISVAFEHENHYKSGLYKEVSHLLITNADLRVLVIYPNHGIEDDEVSKVRRVISESRHATDVAKGMNFLLIMGEETDFTWQGYVYTEDDWDCLVCP